MALAMTEPWSAVVTAALLGTDRQPFQPPSAPGALGQTLAQLGAQPAETALLGTAATLALHRRCGWQPDLVPLAPQPPCPPVDLPLCGLPAIRLLQQMLLKREAKVLPEWIKLVAQHGQRLPEPYLPSLLTLGQKQPDLQTVITSALGERGRWLAAQNPDWHYALPPTSDHWQTGSLEQRLAYLTALRSQDPDRARSQLSDGLTTAAAADVPKLLGALRVGLSMADEPFLEDLLSDRRKKVRHQAAQLLTHLPESRLAQRMVARIAPLILLTVVNGKVSGIAVTLPEHCDEAMMQDGIEPKLPKADAQKFGERAWWLLQLLAATPLAHWEQAGQLHDPATVAALLQQITDHEWWRPLRRGWLQATQRQGSPHWSLAWLNYLRDLVSGAMQLSDLRQCLDNLTWEQRQQWIAQDYPSPQARHVMPMVLAEDREPWSPTVARLVLENVLQTLNDPEGATWFTFDLLKVAALCIDPGFLPEATAICAQLQADSRHHDYYDKELQRFLATLQFRQALHQAFTE